MRKLLVLILSIFAFAVSFASHNRAGEITFCTDDGLTYYFTVITYTDPNSCNPDRCIIEINYGDGTTQDIVRTNGGPCPIPASCGNSQPDCSRCGEIISNSIKKNIYTSVHTYPGPGNYTVSVMDQNRVEGVLNIPESENVAFYVENELIINPFFGVNCNPELRFPPIDNGCIGYPFQHNPGAVDPEGDSLSFSIIPCSGEDGNYIPGYLDPNLAPNLQGNLSIDQFGTIVWDSPMFIGKYNICILIEEYRSGTLIGSVIRDMQITIAECPINEPPLISLNQNICVTAGDSVNELIYVTDPNEEDWLSLSSEGEVYDFNTSPAVFDSTEGYTPLESIFSWQTECSHIRKNDYDIYFKAFDNRGTRGLSDFKTMEIQVVAPAPKNLTANPQGNNIFLNWDNSICSNASCYQVFRKIDSLGYKPEECITGVPEETGYELITTIEGHERSEFLDSNNETGLTYGVKYCYMVVACFEDGSESYPTTEICTQLKRDVPIITRVSINTTDLTNGNDTVTWSAPTELDTIEWPGPYSYKIYRENTFIGTTAENQHLYFTDTTYVDDMLNTKENQYNYFIELIGNNDTIGQSQLASSVFLSTTPTDNIIDLSWDYKTPWTNEKYFIFKKDEQGSFALIDSSVTQFYRDSSLINGVEYCYYIKTIGNYSIDGLLSPIINNSQISCNQPTDDVSPCPPEIVNTSNANCDLYSVEINWLNPNTYCTDDVVGYNIYYAPTKEGTLSIIDTIGNPSINQYTYIDSISIAGCYAITAVDTFYNESNIDSIYCFDNCPIYELPKVFTPGGDGFNDLFKPFPYRYIESVNISIFNRWGLEVFSTTNKDILWDGYNINNQKKCSEGVYYYVGNVNEIRLTGIENRDFKGYVHLIRE